ncbi:MAG TPA: DNA repair protein RadC [Caldisericia bacterium]|nr:DNA repair protein RadC [Caldisericia bacterium]HQL66227.1 DNA repair protein RadC [Caldisericia bacterium]HQN49300.1 DNA repair protein RadC [Caldisericia bacterium]
MKNIDNRRKEIFNILVENKTYPYINKKGKLYFRKKIKFLNDEKIEEIKNLFEIKDKESCDKFREEIKKEVLKNKEYVSIKNWVKEERPREMLIKYGEKNLSLSKLLSIILRTGKEGESAEELANKILNKYKSLREIDSVSIDELCKIEGIGLAKATQIKASFEIGKRLLKESSSEKKKIKNPDDIIDFVSEYYGSYLRDAKKEFFNIILLDIKNKVVDTIELSKGSINASVVDPREVIKEATLKSASSIILVHNHPSGDTEPSTDDINITKKIKEACDIVGIKVLDHIIIGKNKEDYTSFAKLGLI